MLIFVENSNIAVLDLKSLIHNNINTVNIDG